MAPPNDEFAAVLERWAEGSRAADEWERYVITHYEDSKTEEVRREVVRLLVFGEDSQTWPPSEVTSRRLRELARSIKRSAA